MISMAAHARAVPAPSVPVDDEDRHFCPHCGGSLRQWRQPFEHPAFDDRCRAVIVAGERRQIGPIAWAILSAMRRAFERSLSRELLVGLQKEDTNNETLAAHVFWLRRALEGSDLAIETSWGHGYRLVWAKDALPIRTSRPRRATKR